MFNRLVYDNIKGNSAGHKLEALTILSGPNESGKSGEMEALRLAITGSIEKGRSAAITSRIASGPARAVAYLEDGTEYAWSGGGRSVTHTPGPDTQGSMPLTVDDFWALTAEARLKLIAGDDDRLSRLVAEAEQLKADKAAVEVILAKVAPPTPDIYEGPSASEIDEQLGDIGVQLSSHRKAAAGAREAKDLRERLKTSLESNEQCLNTVLGDLSKAEVAYTEAKRTMDQWAPLYSLYQEASSAMPEYVASMASRGLDSSALSVSIQKIIDAAKWMRQNGVDDPALGVAIESLSRVEIPVVPVPQPTFERSEELKEMADGTPPDRNDADLRRNLESLEKTVLHLRASVQKLQGDIRTIKANQQVDAVEHGTLLDDEAFEALVLKHEQLQVLSRQCGEWESFNKRSGEYAVERSRAAFEKGEIEAKIDANREKQTEVIKSLKDKPQERANALLSSVGCEPMLLSIEATPKKSRLEVVIGDVHIDALAKSRKLLYGLALVSAIHELSDATSPVLLSQCAEMDHNMFAKAIKAMSTRSKGNVVLEHWAVPETEEYVIDCSNREEVAV